MVEPEDVELKPGDRIADRYVILAVVGSGRMGSVYKCRHEVLGRVVAIKTLQLKCCNDERIRRRFEREARLASRMDHQNLICVSDFGYTKDGAPYLVMDFVEGEQLYQVLRRETRLQPERTISLFIQVCDGLYHAHQRGVIHRDLKPANILVVNSDGTETVKVVDLGIAKIVHGEDESDAITKAGEVCGSPVYLSPEQCLYLELDNRTDIYSLGVCLYECLTGRPPLKAATVYDTLKMHVYDTPVPFSVAVPGIEIPQKLEEVVMRCLAKDKVERYETMMQVKHELMRSRKSEFDTISVNVMPPETFYPQQKSNKLRGSSVEISMIDISMVDSGKHRSLAELQPAGDMQSSADRQVHSGVLQPARQDAGTLDAGTLDAGTPDAGGPNARRPEAGSPEFNRTESAAGGNCRGPGALAEESGAQRLTDLQAGKRYSNASAVSPDHYQQVGGPEQQGRPPVGAMPCVAPPVEPADNSSVPPVASAEPPVRGKKPRREMPSAKLAPRYEAEQGAAFGPKKSPDSGGKAILLFFGACVVVGLSMGIGYAIINNQKAPAPAPTTQLVPPVKAHASAQTAKKASATGTKKTPPAGQKKNQQSTSVAAKAGKHSTPRSASQPVAADHRPSSHRSGSSYNNGVRIVRHPDGRIDVYDTDTDSGPPPSRHSYAEPSSDSGGDVSVQRHADGTVDVIDTSTTTRRH